MVSYRFTQFICSSFRLKADSNDENCEIDNFIYFIDFIFYVHLRFHVYIYISEF